MRLIPWGRSKREAREKQALVSVSDNTWSRIFDWAPGRWQQNAPLDRDDSVVSNPTVYACITRIASDIGKLRPTTQAWNPDYGVWLDRPIPRFLRVLMSPNNYQSHIEFKEWYLYSKLLHGNTYVLIERDSEGKIQELHILDPTRVTPLVSESGDVFYRLDTDNLSRLRMEQVVVPDSEVIHDRMNALFHPLVGLSPIYACTIAAQQGLAIQKDSRRFFENGAQPSGVLTAPGPISDETAQRLKEYWQGRFTGTNAGSVAVVGDGLKYESMRMNSVDAQVIDQLNWTAETICSVFQVPPHKVGVGTMPTHDNIEALTQAYYSDCLQTHIEKMEQKLASGLGFTDGTRLEMDLQGLFRMDALRQIEVLQKGIAGTIMAPNEARRKLNLKPIEGGDALYLQQQNYSLEALAQRDAQNPLAVQQPEPEPPVIEPPADEPPVEDAIRHFQNLIKSVPLLESAR